MTFTSEVTDRYLRSQYKKEIATLRYTKGRSFVIDYKTIPSNPLAGAVLTRKAHADYCFVESLRKVGVEEDILKGLQIRYINLPTVSIRNLKSDLVGQTRSFEGIVRRVSEVKSKATVAVFECSVCTATVQVSQESGITFPDSKCEMCGKTAKWRVTDKGSFIDYQQLIVQEFPESVSGGDQPKSIVVTVTDDLCGAVIPGNRITVCGLLKLKKIKNDSGLIFEPFVEGNSIVIKDETYDNIVIEESDLKQFEELKNTPDLLHTFASSIAPTVYGNDEVKRGICLQLFGGVPKTIAGTRIRGDIHLLMIGDPGIAKSVIMKHAISLLPRGIFTHGNSSSKAGLTATAVKDEDGQWVLEAGALVLANGGMCAVDELDKMNDNDREALHGAMEQQELDIAKAGIVAKLYTRCSLLAAANPKMGRFDLCQSLSNQFDLAPTLISRFDLIYPLTDVPEEKRDSNIADYILNTHRTQQVEVGIPQDLFRKYVAHARTLNPILTKEAADMIKDYYTKVRSMANNMHTVPITARSLEGLVRLSEAAARMRLSSEVTPDDASVVITLVDGCLKKIAYDSRTNTWDIDKVINRYSKKSSNIIGRITDSIISIGDDRGVAKVEDVVAYMKEHYNVSPEESISHIELMRQETRIISPRDGYVRLFK